MPEEPASTARNMPIPADEQAGDSQPTGVTSKQQETGGDETAGSFAPQGEIFWENSVDAHLINLSENDMPSEENPAEQASAPVNTAEEASQDEHQQASPAAADPHEELNLKKEGHSDNAEPLESMAGPDETDTGSTITGSIQQAVEDLEVVAEKETKGDDLPEEETSAREQETSQASDEETAAPEEDPGETPSDDEILQQPAGLLKKKWAVYGCGAVLLAVIGLILIFKSSSPSDNDPVQLTQPAVSPEDLYAMTFFLPLDAGSNEERFIKATISVAPAGQEARQAIERKLKEVRKEIIELVLARSFKEMQSRQEINALREEITARLNQSLLHDGIKDTYITELLVL